MYSQRYVGGFVNADGSRQVDALFLNNVEAALLSLFGVTPATNGALVWDGTKFTAANLIKNAQIDAAAAIDKTKLAPLSISDADVAGGAAISGSKLANNIPPSKLSAYPADPSKVLKGDGSWAGSMVKVDEQTLGATGAFSFTLPSGYRHARIEAKIRSTAALRFDAAFLRFNADATAKYFWSYVRGSDTGTSASGNPTAAATEAQIAIVPGATGGSGLPAAVIIDIIDYANTDGFTKPFITQSWCLGDGAVGGTQSQFGGGSYNVAGTALTSVVLFCTGGTNIAAACRASLYMIG